MTEEESFSASEIYGATFLNPKAVFDMNMEGTQVIDKVERLTFSKEDKNDEKKLGLIFQKFPEFQLVLNKTNTKVLVDKFGDDFRKWIGNPVEIKIKNIEVSGKPMDVIRLEINEPAEKN